MSERNAVEVTSDPNRLDLESGATLNTSIQALEAPTAPRASRSLVRTLSIATMLPFARMEEQFLRVPHHGMGALAQSPYVAFIEYGEADLVPILGFTLGAPRIAVPKRVRLTAEAMRSLAIGHLILGPLSIDVKEP